MGFLLSALGHTAVTKHLRGGGVYGNEMVNIVKLTGSKSHQGDKRCSSQTSVRKFLDQVN